MAKAQLQCPACGSRIQLGDIECKVCGVNLKSGESFAARAKKAKGKAVHPEHFAGRLYFGVVIAFGLFVFAGLMYQTQMVERSFKERPDLYQGPVQQIQQIQDLITEGDQEQAAGNAKAAQEHYTDARDTAKKLMDALDTQVNSIKPEEPYAPEQQSPYAYGSAQPKYNRTMARRLLSDLRAKAENQLNRIPTG